MATPKVLSHDIGDFIRDLRQNARISLRQLAEQAGVSNPYLSQIERGLRKPSAEVLAQLATALRVSTPVMYLRAGLLDLKDGPGTLAAIAGDPDLTDVQKQTLTQIYETFRRENARDADTTPPAATTTSRRASGPTDTAVAASPLTPIKSVPPRTEPSGTASTRTAASKAARGQNRAGQDRADQNRAGQDRAGTNGTAEVRFNEDHQGRDRD